jgi:hypothetical protein
MLSITLVPSYGSRRTSSGHCLHVHVIYELWGMIDWSLEGHTVRNERLFPLVIRWTKYHAFDSAI